MHGFKKLSIVCTTLMILPTLAVAQTAPQAVVAPSVVRPGANHQPTIGKSWPKIIEALQKKGITHVGVLDLAKFTNVAQTVTWTSNSALPPEEITGTRRSAYFDTLKKEVFISPNLPKDEVSALPNLELHEVMGAIGVDDHAYTYSTALNQLSRVKDSNQQKKLAEEYGKSIFTMASLEGGGNSVSGGGDLTALFVKNEILNQIMRDQKNVSMDFMIDYPHINFEPIYHSDVKYVSMEYQFRTAENVKSHGPIVGAVAQKRHGLNYEELITIMIPVPLLKSSRSRSAVLKDIENKIRSIFPVSHSDPLENYTPQNCDAAHKINFPLTTDESAREIQGIRAGILSGCDLRSDDMSMTTPALPRGESPDEVGLVYYNCRVGNNPQYGDYVLQAPRNANNLGSVGVNLSDGFYVAAGIYTRVPDGAIQFAYLTYIEKPSGHQTFLKSPANSDGSAKIHAIIHGESVSFACTPKKISDH